MVKGIAFDMDGTLTMPRIDFDGIREKIGGLSPDLPIYEQALKMAEPERARAIAILEETEMEAAKDTEPNPGIYKLVDYLEKSGIKHYINFNYRRCPAVMLAKRLIAEGKLGGFFIGAAPICNPGAWIRVFR
jgi:beta-phosphoglucomutase-like phosphatase (HAD superfamily)